MLQVNLLTVWVLGGRENVKSGLDMWEPAMETSHIYKPDFTSTRPPKTYFWRNIFSPFIYKIAKYRHMFITRIIPKQL
jgi:hypothetical protein